MYNGMMLPRSVATLRERGKDRVQRILRILRSLNGEQSAPRARPRETYLCPQGCGVRLFQGEECVQPHYKHKR